MYKIVLPILGFEGFNSLSIEKIDESFSFLVLNEKTKITVMNIKALNKISFNFEIDDSALEKLKIKSKNDFDTYFVVVSQNPIENSIVNLISPILINEKEKLIGQYLTSLKVDPCLASIDECAI
ncbi:putative flagellin level sensor protein FliW [Arcobacter acticola]|jgi:flagellar assembly factor FliW|uniref:Putative flagellin level sensor protein FliW n=1 Tax=Arcobacter acticola TaxID=1849015 RepID=A0A6M8ET60_9BACT|nr:flagellar assembly protein FliW [Arcobacter acticola]QKE27627.1 putative flagellin level sensor protein FliW [Arcobacter acticola]